MAGGINIKNFNYLGFFLPQNSMKLKRCTRIPGNENETDEGLHTYQQAHTRNAQVYNLWFSRTSSGGKKKNNSEDS